MAIGNITIVVSPAITTDEANDLITPARKTIWTNHNVSKVYLVVQGLYIMIYTDVFAVNEKILRTTIPPVVTPVVPTPAPVTPVVAPVVTPAT